MRPLAMVSIGFSDGVLEDLLALSRSTSAPGLIRSRIYGLGLRGFLALDLGFMCSSVVQG